VFYGISAAIARFFVIRHFIHPWQLPTAVCHELIKSSSNDRKKQGNNILDKIGQVCYVFIG
jgi:hypothetical protein